MQDVQPYSTWIRCCIDYADSINKSLGINPDIWIWQLKYDRGLTPGNAVREYVDENNL